MEGVPRKSRVLLSAWCPCKEPALLAVALEGGTVLVLAEDGSLHEEVTRNRASRNGGDAVPTCMSWTTNQLQGGNVLLAIGWQDGVVMVWSEKDRMERCDDDQHAGYPISFVYFSPETTRLIAADCRPGVPTRPQEAAVCCVYKVDVKGRFNAISPYRKPAAGALTHSVFRTEGQKKKLVTSSFAAADVPPFYYGGETGVILMGDDLGRCSEVIPPLGGAVGALLYLPERDTLVAVTKNAMLCTFKLTDNKPVALVKSKLSVGREGFQSASWCGVGQLAIVSADAVVRVNDLLDDEDNFALPLSEVNPTSHPEPHLEPQPPLSPNPTQPQPNPNPTPSSQPLPNPRNPPTISDPPPRCRAWKACPTSSRRSRTTRRAGCSPRVRRRVASPCGGTRAAACAARPRSGGRRCRLRPSTRSPRR